MKSNKLLLNQLLLDCFTGTTASSSCKSWLRKLWLLLRSFNACSLDNFLSDLQPSLQCLFPLYRFDIFEVKTKSPQRNSYILVGSCRGSPLIKPALQSILQSRNSCRPSWRNWSGSEQTCPSSVGRDSVLTVRIILYVLIDALGDRGYMDF